MPMSFVADKGARRGVSKIVIAPKTIYYIDLILLNKKDNKEGQKWSILRRHSLRTAPKWMVPPMLICGHKLNYF